MDNVKDLPAARRCRHRWLAAAAVAMAAQCCVGAAAAQSPGAELDKALSLQAQSDDAAAASQRRVAQLADETSELLGDYRAASQRLDQLTAYNRHLRALVADQEREKDSINRQLDDFTGFEQGIIPLMADMIDDLENFVRLDMPFRREERLERVRQLRDDLDRADITVSEKYRQIMDAYQTEASYGRDMEAWSGKLPATGQEVDFLRVGRILLAYQTPDRRTTGFWNKQSGQWEVLDDEYRNAVTDGLRMARRQQAPDLLRLPVPAPEAPQ